jgi:glycosyltransferase involved in cell wall biosynthesis
LRLCHIGNPNSIHVYRHLQFFASRGHEVILLGNHPPEKPLPNGVILHDLTAQTNLRKLRFLAWAAAVRRIVRQLEPDLLHAHSVANAGWLGAAAGFHPLVVTAWGSDLLVAPKRSRLQRYLARWVLRKADYVTCVSDDLVRAAGSLGADPDRLEVVQWGVDTMVFHPASDRSALRSQLGFGPGPLVLSLRAMRAIYNPLDIARAIPLIVDQVPDVQFLILVYGEDPSLLAEFQAIVQSQCVTEHVRYVDEQGSDEAIADLNRIADIAVSVSSSDGTPVSVLEAMACGAALVVSDLPSLREWIQDEREGLIVPVSDVQALSRAVVRLLQDPVLRHQIQTKSQVLVRERADRRVWMARTEEIYRQMAQGSA